MGGGTDGAHRSICCGVRARRLRGTAGSRPTCGVYRTGTTDPAAGRRAGDAPADAHHHAITIDVPPEVIWPWLTQMGWHLGGYYTPEWVDRLLFPQNLPSLDHLDPALVRDLRVG